MEALLSIDTRQTAIDKYPVRRGTGSSYFKSGYTDKLLNSPNYRDESTTLILKENIQDNNLIRLREKFNIEINKFQETSKTLANKAFDHSVFYLLGILPEKITVEVTDDESFYFSIIKRDFSIYIEEYVDDGEVIATVFRDGIKQNSISGTIESVTSRLQEVTSY